MLKDNREDDGGEKKRTEGERGRESTVKNNKQKKKNKACVERERFTTHRPSLRLRTCSALYRISFFLLKDPDTIQNTQ